ncbi:MAG: flavoprotein [Nocardioides sp.]
MTAKVLYHLVCAAPPALSVEDFVGLAQDSSWEVCLIATPRAATWIDLGSLRELTGHPVRTDHKRPGEPDVLPPPTAMTVGPLTFNTLNKWALGIADNLVLGLLTEALGLRLPVAALPYMNAAQASHPSVPIAVDRLRRAGGRVLLKDDRHPGFEPHPPGKGDRRGVQWRLLLDSVAPR